MLITFGSLLPFPTIEAAGVIPNDDYQFLKEAPLLLKNHQIKGFRITRKPPPGGGFWWQSSWIFLSFFVNQIQDSTNTACGKWLLKISSPLKRGEEKAVASREHQAFKGKCAYNISSCKRGSFSRLLFYYHAHSGGKSLKKFHCRSLSDIIFAL